MPGRDSDTQRLRREEYREYAIAHARTAWVGGVSAEDWGSYGIIELTPSGTRWWDESPKERDDVFNSGWLAFHEGDSCRYKHGSQRREVWEKGYALAEKDGHQPVRDALCEAVYADIGEPEELFESVRAWLDKSGFSQEELAKTVGVSRPTLNRWLQGKVKPSPEKMQRVQRIITQNKDAKREARFRRRPLEVKEVHTFLDLTPRQQRQRDKKMRRLGGQSIRQPWRDDTKPRKARKRTLGCRSIYGDPFRRDDLAFRQIDWGARREAARRGQQPSEADEWWVHILGRAEEPTNGVTPETQSA